MSRQNKVNKNNYVQAGRLTPDDIARERRKMAGPGERTRVKNQVSKPPSRRRSESSPKRTRREQ